ncbi:MAG: O-antigen ligase family protein [Desulfitobacteriaceae bacterium]
MGTISQNINKAGSSKERILAFSIVLCLLAHGLFFPNEWLGLGFLIFAYALWQRKGFYQGAVSPDVWTVTDTYFIAMLGLTIWGLCQPVKVAEGLVGICRWTTLWYIYRWSREIGPDSRSRFWLIHWIQLTAVFLAGVGWFTKIVSTFGESTVVLGRLSSWFGYPNSLAAFLGAALLLKPRRFSMRMFLGISLLSTGSRAAIGLFILVSGFSYVASYLRPGNTILQAKRSWKAYCSQKWSFLFWKNVFLVFIGLSISVLFFKPAWVHLLEWSLANSSWGERLLYYEDGFKLAWAAYGLPRAGGWKAFPTVQQIPYWTADPHSSLINILLNQGFLGLISAVTWITLVLRAKLHQVSKISWEGSLNLLGALVFLVLHSLVDADFSFGVLGIIFWILFGLDCDLSTEPFLLRSKVVNFVRAKRFKAVERLTFLGFFNTWIQRLVPMIFTFVLLLGSLSLAIKPDLLNAGEIWSLQAQRLRVRDPSQSISLWHKSLFWDQTQVAWQRHLAEQKFQQGHIVEGLKQVENVLSWQGFDLGAYEWAQSLVWEIAERKRSSGINQSTELYNWVEHVPERIDLKLATISVNKRRLWLGSSDFRPTQHIKLLADYARLRQLTK